MLQSCADLTMPKSTPTLTSTNTAEIAHSALATATEKGISDSEGIFIQVKLHSLKNGTLYQHH